MKRQRICEGCGIKFSASQKKALAKHKFHSHECYLSSRSSSYMASIAKVRTRHGMYRSRIYRIWGAMKQRCLNTNAVSYAKYGGAGITLDIRWYDFENFYADMGSTYRDPLTIDRIDGTKGYTKENCRWATRREQSSNVRNNVFVECEGEVLCASACARKLGVHPSTVLARIYKGNLKQVYANK